MIGKLLCPQCHTGTQPAASPRYDTSRTIIYCIIPPFHVITNILNQGDCPNCSFVKVKKNFKSSSARTFGISVNAYISQEHIK